MARSHTVSFTIKAPLGPMERGDLFEDPLYEWLDRNGSVVIDGGGGTMVHANGRVVSDFFVEVPTMKHINEAIKFIKSLGVPAGSSYRVDGKDAVPIGDCQGIEFSLEKRAGRGTAKLVALFNAVKAAVVDRGRLFHTRENENRLVFAIYGKVPNDIRAALGALSDEYSKYDPQISPVSRPRSARPASKARRTRK